jgi:hypothetical protein
MFSKANWYAISLIAEELLKHKTMTGALVKTTVAAHRRVWPQQ